MIIVLIVWVLIGIVAGSIGASKGRSGCGFFLLGMTMGPVALAVALIIGPLEHAGALSADLRRCPRCAESIRFDALACRHCGVGTPPPVYEPADYTELIWGAVAGALIITVLVWMVYQG